MHPILLFLLMVSHLPEDHYNETLNANLSVFSNQVEKEIWSEYKGVLYGPLDIISLYYSLEKMHENPFIKILLEKASARINELESLLEVEKQKTIFMDFYDDKDSEEADIDLTLQEYYESWFYTGEEALQKIMERKEKLRKSIQ